MKKTLVKGLVALAAGALLVGGLLGCQQTVDSFTVKPSSLDSANVKAVHTPGFFALTWDRVKNCAGYDIEAKDVATGEIISLAENLSFTKTDITVDDLWMTSDPDVKEWLEKNLSPEKDYRAEYEFTVIARSSSASGRAATAVGVQNSYSSTTVEFKPWADNTAKPAVPGDVKATLVYDPLSEGETTTTGTLTVYFTAKAGVEYGIVDDLSQISVSDNNVYYNYLKNYDDYPPYRVYPAKSSPMPFDGTVPLVAKVDDVTPGKDYSYNLLAGYAGPTVSGNALYSVKELTVTPTAQEASANFAVSSDEKTAGDTVTIGAEWNKAYGGSLEYAVLTTPVAYNPGMTAAEIYAALGTKTKVVDVAEDNVAPDRNVATFTVNRADKDTVTYVVVILKKGDTYNMRTITVAPKDSTVIREYRGYAEVTGTNASKQYLAKVHIEFLDGTDITTLAPTEVSYKIGWTAYKTLSTTSFNDEATVRIPVKSDKTTASYVKSDYNEFIGPQKNIYEYSETVLFGTNTDTMDDVECALYVDDELVTRSNP